MQNDGTGAPDPGGIAATAPAASAIRRGDALWMAAGAAAIGLSGFVFLSAISRGGLDPTAAAALSSVYLLSNIVGPGVFVAIEQETSRRVSAAVGRAGFGPGRTATGRAATGRAATGRATVVLAGLTLVVLVAAGTAMLAPVLRGDPALLVALAVSVVGSAAVFRVRGLLGGRRRFRRYAGSLLVDAGVRIVGVMVLVLAGVTAAWPFALALCAAPGVAAVVTRLRGAGDEDRVEDRDGDGVPRAIAQLLAASVLAMVVANLAPVLVNAALPADPARAFAFACVLVLTRVPLLLTGPLQAMLLPQLASAAARGAIAEVRRKLRRGLVVAGALGVVAVAGAWVFGRPTVALVFGRGADLMSRTVVALLATSAALLLAVAVVQPALIALGGHRSLVLGWGSGAIAFGVVFAAVHDTDPVAAAVAATLAAPVVTLIVQLIAVRRDALPNLTAG